jgi:hypothetical protein
VESSGYEREDERRPHVDILQKPVVNKPRLGLLL